MRRHLKKRLVDHPIHLLWSHFLWHLAHEFWNLDLQTRVAILFLAVGALAKVSCVMTWYLWYPRTILVCSVMLGSWIYLNASDIPQRIQRIGEAIAELPNRIPETLERMDPQQTRILCVVLFFVPTLLQVRTISFLAGLNALGGGFMWNFWITVSMVAVSAYYLNPPRTKVAHDISQLCLLVLYGSALWITLHQWDILTMPSLAAPFFLSTGTLLLVYDDQDSMEWFSRTVRYALRLTLRDVLATVGESVQEDEMLQLAMLRWIVDYWSYTPPQPSQQQQHQNASSSSNPTATATATPSAPLPSQATRHTPPEQELQWDDLLPMLNIATNQMTSEVHSLQHPQSTPPRPSSSTAPNRPPAGATQGRSNPTASRPNSTANSSSSQEDDPLQGLHAMLASMNVDDRAKPAVAAYKRNVEEFPPSRELALGVAIIRRCPACLTLLWHLLVASMFQPFTISMRIVLLLLPLIGLEVMRIQAWAVACEALSHVIDDGKDECRTEEENASASTAASMIPYSKLLSQVDLMTILLSGDDDTIISKVRTDTGDGVTSTTAQMTIPSLLLVWRNVQSSVKALEVSLTAARCAQTGAVALEFAKNVMSLAQFGSEVSRHGWMHGLTVIAKEVIFNHQGDVRRAPEGSAATFTYAAVSAVHNGQVVARNLQVLATEDANVSHIFGPVAGLVGFVGSLFHRGDTDQGQPTADAETTEEETISTSTEEYTPGDEKKHADSVVQESSDTTVTSKGISSEAKLSQDEWDDLPSQVHGQESSTVTAIIDTKVAASASNEFGERQVASAGNPIEPKAAIAKRTIQIKERAVAEPVVPSDKPIFADIGQESISQDVKLPGTTTKKDSDPDPSDDLALVMELIADAFELNLIDESEKNEFCLKLCGGAKDKDLIVGMKKTLQGLILEVSHDHAGPIAPAALSPVQDKNQAEDSNIPATETSKSDSAWSPIIDAVASEEQAAIQPLDYSKRLADAVRTREEMNIPQLLETEELATIDGDGIPTVASSAPNERRRGEDEESMWVKVGGGIAVLGAVVGGAFLAMNQDNPNNSNNNNNATRNQSSAVTIEQVGDDNDNDEGQNNWESMGRDSNRQPQ